MLRPESSRYVLPATKQLTQVCARYGACARQCGPSVYSNPSSSGGIDAYCATIASGAARLPRYAGCAVLGGPFSEQCIHPPTGGGYARVYLSANSAQFIRGDESSCCRSERCGPAYLPPSPGIPRENTVTGALSAAAAASLSHRQFQCYTFRTSSFRAPIRA